MDEKRQDQIVESLKKIDPKVIADVLREIIRSDDEPPIVRREPTNPDHNSPK